MIREKSKGKSVKAKALMSMTGFAKAQASNNEVAIELELRSVNSRFLDLNLRLPKEYQLFEQIIRKKISSEVSRGRIEMNCLRHSLSTAQRSVRMDQDLLDQYLSQAEQVARARGLWSKECERELFLEFIGRREILDNQEGDIDIQDEQVLFESALEEALKSLREMRAQEGADLHRDLLERISTLSDYTVLIEENLSGKATAIQERLVERISKLISESTIDSQRLEMEVAILVDKSDISEELVRIKSHLSQFRLVLESPPNGRKLDFLLQEFLREFNTIGSKIQDSQSQQLVVDAKSIIEKLKEQVQNVE